MQAGRFSYNGMKVCVTLSMLVAGILRAIKCQYPVAVIVGFTMAAKAFSVWAPLLAGIRSIPAGTSLAEGIRMKRADRAVILACHSLLGCDSGERLCDGICKDVLASKFDRVEYGHPCEAAEKVNSKGEFVRRFM